MPAADARGGHTWRAWLGVFAGYAALAVALTWPLVTDLTGLVVPDRGDPLLNTWILWWNAQALPLTEHWWNAPAFFPASGVLAFSEHLLGLSPLTSPIIWLSGSPLAAYNIALLLTFALSATAAHALGLELTGRRGAALICGVAFGFAPYRIAQLPHLQVLASFWLPLALLGLHRFSRTGRARHLILFAGAWYMQALSNGYFMLFLPVLIAMWCAWFVRPREWRTLASIAGAAAATVAALAPFLLKYRSVHAAYGLERDFATKAWYGADIASWLNAPSRLALWGDMQLYHRPEGELFTGFAVVALVAAGLFVSRRRREGVAVEPLAPGSMLVFYALAALAMFVLAWGPSPTWRGEPLLPVGPYRWLMALPGFDGLRVPARFAMLMVLCLSAAAALAYAVLTVRWMRTARTIGTAVLATMLVLEGWPAKLPMQRPPGDWDVRPADVTGALLVLPATSVPGEVAIMYRAMALGRPTVNGYSGHYPPWYHMLLKRLRDFDPDALEALADVGVTHIAIDNARDGQSEWRNYVLTRARLTKTTGDGALSLFALPPGLVGAAGPIARIQAIEVSEHPALVPTMTDRDPSTFWHSRPQSGGETVLIDLGESRLVGEIELSVGRFVDAYPRELLIETSADGSAWSQAWRGSGGRRQLAALLERPREPSLRFPIPARETRFLRLTQTGRTDQSTWTIAELVVRAP